MSEEALVRHFLGTWTWHDIIARKAGYCSLAYARVGDEHHISKAVQALEAEGLDFTLKDSAGNTLLFTIIERGSSAWYDLIMFIFNHPKGVNLTRCTSWSWLPLVAMMRVVPENVWVAITQEYIAKGGALDCASGNHVLLELTALWYKHEANLAAVCELLLPHVSDFPLKGLEQVRYERYPPIKAAVEVVMAFQRNWSPLRGVWIGAIVRAGFFEDDKEARTKRLCL